MKFTRISRGSSQDTQLPESPLEMLLGCHARIRHFMQLSRTLANAEGVPSNEIADAASAIFRYFSLALPLHEADENESLFPRFRDALPSGNLLREGAITMVEQHKAVDELADELLPLCATLSSCPERLPSLALRLDHATDALSQVFTAHLELEETVIFPAMVDLLGPAEIGEMSREMYARRRPPVGTIHLVQ